MSENHVSIEQVKQLIADGAELPYVVTDTLKAYEAMRKERDDLAQQLEEAIVHHGPESGFFGRMAARAVQQRKQAESAYEAMKQERDELRVQLFTSDRFRAEDAYDHMQGQLIAAEGRKQVEARAEAAEATIARLTALPRHYEPHFQVMVILASDLDAALSASSTPDSNAKS